MHNSHPKAIAALACLGTLIAWSTGPLFIEYMSFHMDSWTQNALRYTVGALFWLPLLIHAAHTSRLKREVWTLALVPTVPNIIQQSLWAAAFYYGSPAFVALLTRTNVLWITALSLLLFPAERVAGRRGRFWVGLVLSMAGVAGVLFFKPGALAETTLNRGALLALTMAFFSAVYAILVKTSMRRINSFHGFAVVSLYTMIGLWIPALVWGSPSVALTLGPGPWAAVVVSGVTAISLGHVLYYVAIKRVGATIPALVILAQPLVVLALSGMVFGERMMVPQVLSGLLLLAGAAAAILAADQKSV